MNSIHCLMSKAHTWMLDMETKAGTRNQEVNRWKVR